MIFIAHRGNISGRRAERENTEAYLMEATAAGFEVEVDVWHLHGEFYLGHDRAERRTTRAFLSHPKFCLHAKNLAALAELRRAGWHCFFHDGDAATLTSKGFIWTFPGGELTELSISVLPERADGKFGMCAGVCSDVVSEFRARDRGG